MRRYSAPTRDPVEYADRKVLRKETNALRRVTPQIDAALIEYRAVHGQRPERIGMTFDVWVQFCNEQARARHITEPAGFTQYAGLPIRLIGGVS